MERRVINPWTWQDRHAFVQAVAVSGVTRSLICAGQASMSAEGKALHPGDMRAQLGQALDTLEVVLAEAGFALKDVVRLNYFATDLDAFFAQNGEFKERLRAAGCRPASSMYEVRRLGTPELMIEIEALALA